MNPQHGHWQLEVDADGIAWLGLDRQDASTNSLGRAVMEELDACLARLERDLPRALVVWSRKDNGFVAGADISEFTSLVDEKQAHALVRGGQQVFDRLEALPCPTVAALHGFALGGGLELALACRHRVAVDDERLALGLPEVMLGIHPGFGGTVRTPRLIGAPAALDLMLTGRTLRGARALKLGLVDRLVAAGELREAARQMALSPPDRRRPAAGLRMLSLPVVRHFVAQRVRREVMRRARPEHYPAPFAIIDLWQAHGARGAAAMEAEARSISRLFLTPASRNLVRVFFLQDRLKALGGGSPQAFQRVHVVGAGLMGGDIAAWCAYRGLEVTLQDRDEPTVAAALERARVFFDKRCRRPGQAAECAARLHADVDATGVAAADVVIEAIFEDAAAKRALYQQLEPQLKPGALLATNTSSLVLESLATGLADPSRFVGLHFFNPVARMMLVEIVHGQATGPDAQQAAAAFARRLDRLPLPCRSAPGFVVNRVLMPYMTEAMFAAADGVPLATIDLAATDFGMPMGPAELADTVGLDVALHVGRILAQAFGRTLPAGLEALVAAGRLGRKSGHGLYEWRDGKALKGPLGECPADLQDRLVLQYLNEAVACLREGIVEDPDLLDAGMIFGTGFAPFRGGPVHYARQRGVAAIVARLEELERVHGARFRPDPGWRSLPVFQS
jgi:3-hydroxyacyl-CoA dehydrogenase / enoyl-CoA hydratase / 3-hydroxybutyryl-CoA epimerase